ncbi:hypothetical protein AMATHDRAFT_54172 [Amanita thiersii Skay4041]|uniref:BRCT domain-containing protein n=1 Tax=Amanita thiersii Skay4041 TaxID=703135 RepID=A0A2A9NZX2_9AGAR|nr:hypothetical protein AMATHDRAFT_54172 [Amanita thiersii Skay4041]
MLGTPLAIYIEKDVQDKDTISQLITKHGGTVSPGYSGVPYILVEPHKPSGQNLWRQYAGKKGKLVLDARWVHECIKSGELQTVHSNWAGCKVTGTETLTPALPPPPQPVEMQPMQPAAMQGLPQGQAARKRVNQCIRDEQVARQLQAPPQVPPPPPLPSHPQQPMSTIPTVESLVHAQAFAYPVYGAPIHPSPRDLHATAPPQTWQSSGSIAPQQTHIAPPPTHPQLLSRSTAYRDDTSWSEYDQAAHGGHALAAPATYDYRYLAAQAPYYDPAAYDQTYEQQPTYMEDPTAPPSAETDAVAGPSTVSVEAAEKSRGRKRARGQSTPATPASALVVNRNPPARSPTPPTRVIKSTYGGNLFTAEDVMYLKKYIDYCQEQGLVLSLREICERIAIKAPHHTFYSWRRYCNKHQIRLGGYVMNADRSESPAQIADPDLEEEEELLHAGSDGMHIDVTQQHISSGTQRNRSPTPPRALYRSTTGKGVAFTEEDVRFLLRFMEYRKSQGRLDMVAFWKDVASKAPHHSRASWMKFWRRHKHELNRSENDEPLPQPPDKKMRYSREDDVLLARFFLNKPEGTSDKIFQQFGRVHPHHPWKGWQEHHRIHKAKIDHLIELLANGQNVDDPNTTGES